MKISRFPKLALVSSLALAILLLASAPAAADDRAQFTGKWVLDLEDSDMERKPVHSEVTLEYLGNGTSDISLKARWVQKDGKVEKRAYTYVCDGQAQDIQEPDFVRSANAVWDDGRLKIVSTASRMGMAFQVDTEWRLKGDDRLEIHNSFVGPFSSSEWTEVYNRKASKK